MSLRVLACINGTRHKLICSANQILSSDVAVWNVFPTRSRFLSCIDKQTACLSVHHCSPFSTSIADKSSSKNTIDSLNEGANTNDVKKKKVYKKPRLEDTMVELYDVNGLLIGQRTLHEAREQAQKEKTHLREITVINKEDKNQKRQYQLEEIKKDRSRVYRINPKITDHDLKIKLNGITGHLKKGEEVIVSIGCGYNEECLVQAKEISDKIREECKDLISSASEKGSKQNISCVLLPLSKREPVHKVKTFTPRRQGNNDSIQ